MNLRETLTRTALLVKLDVFPMLEEWQIIDGLAALHVCLAADRETISCPAGGTALRAAVIAIAQTGAQIHLQLPEDELADQLLALSRELIKPARSDDVEVDLAFVFGKVATARAREVVHVEAGEWNCRLGEGRDGGVHGALPFGALLAACAAGAETLRGALRLLAVKNRVEESGEHRLSRVDNIELRLNPLPPGSVNLGAVDVISAGAITNAALFALSRWTDIQGQLRVIDKDFGEESNLNRYAMLRRRDLGTAKAQVLARSSTGALTIEPVEERYTEEALLTIGDLASRVLVGVDHIPSRWLAARHAPGWICVAGTTHFEVVVSEHGPQGPCAGCLHPRDDPGNADIPTVSFVSQLAGYLQAYRLIGNALGVARSSPTLAAPFNLGAPRAMMSIGIAPRPDCPVGCPASQAFHPRPAARDSVGDLSS